MAVIQDKLTDDSSILNKLSEAACVLFRDADLDLGHRTASQEGVQQCVCDCQRYGLYPSEQNRARLRSSWAALDVRHRQALRKVVRLNDSARNVALMELAGMYFLKPWPSLILADPATMPSTNLTPALSREKKSMSL